MVDFRYHIVSLISVFLALAIGIVLGAGPLRENLGDSLTNQVGVLREEKEQLRAELQESQQEQEISDSLLLAGGRELIATNLTTYTVALIDLGETEETDRETVMQGLEIASATTNAPIQVTEEWWAPGRASFRSGIATSLLEYLDPQPPEASSSEFILGMALAQALTARDPADPTKPASSSESILSILSSANLIEEPAGSVVPAHAVAVFLPHAPQAEGEETPEVDAEPWIQTFEGIGQSPAVAVTELAENNPIVSDLREQPGAKNIISSTDSLGMSVSEILVPRIIAHEILGNRNVFSVADADFILWPGPATLDPWDPTPEPADDETDGETAADGESGNGESADGENAEGDADADAEGADEPEAQSLGKRELSDSRIGALVGA